MASDTVVDSKAQDLLEGCKGYRKDPLEGEERYSLMIYELLAKPYIGFLLLEKADM